MIFLDLETTGFDSTNDKIIEVAIIKVDDHGNIIKTLHQFINPQIKIPLNISNLTGISNQQVANQPIFSEIKNTIIEFLDNPQEIIMGHNIGFDINFLKNNDINLINPLVDTHPLAQISWPFLPSFSLETLTAHLGIKHFPAHSALADIKANNQLWQQIKIALNTISAKQKKQILNLFNKVDALLPDLTDERSYLNPFFKKWFLEIWQNIEISATSNLSNQNIHNNNSIDFFNISINKSALESLIKENNKQNKPIDNTPIFAENLFADITNINNSNNKIENNSNILDVFLAKTLFEKQQTIAEIPNNKNKIFHYLLACLQNKKESQSNSTTYIALDEQDFSFNDLNKQINLLAKKTGFSNNSNKESLNLKISILNPKENYLCLPKWQLFLKQNSFELKEALLASKIIYWLGQTNTGNFKEMAFSPQDYRFWDNLKITADSCPLNCPEQNNCFRKKIIEKTKISDVVLVNHRLLVGIMKNYYLFEKSQHLIIDQVVHFTTTCQKELTETLRIDKIYDLTNNTSKSINLDNSLSIKNSLTKIIAQLNYFQESLFNNIKNTIKSDQYATEINAQAIIHSPQFIQTQTAYQQLLETIQQLLLILKKDNLNVNLFYWHRIFNTLKNFNLKETNSNKIIWIQYYPLTKSFNLKKSIIDFKAIFAKNFIKSTASLLLIDNSLAINQQFSFIKNILWLNNFSEKIFSLNPTQLNSTQLIIKNDIPDSNYQTQQFAEKITSLLLEITSTQTGGTLIIFNSKKDLQTVYEVASEQLTKQGIDILAQGLNSTVSKIIALYWPNSEKKVVFGLRTFWKNFDLDFQNIIVTKIPFELTFSPYFQVFRNLFNNFFTQYSLAKSILEIKKTFHQLIKNASFSKKKFIITDERLTNKNYGKDIIRELEQIIKK